MRHSTHHCIALHLSVHIAQWLSWEFWFAFKCFRTEEFIEGNNLVECYKLHAKCNAFDTHTHIFDFGSLASFMVHGCIMLDWLVDCTLLNVIWMFVDMYFVLIFVFSLREIRYFPENLPKCIQFLDRIYEKHLPNSEIRMANGS